MLFKVVFKKGSTKEAITMALKHIFFSLSFLNLIKKGILHFLNAILVYLESAMIPSDSIFLRALERKLMETFKTSFFSLIFLYLIKKAILP